VDVNQAMSELTALPVADRLRVVESLWDSIESDTGVSLSPEQRAELDRRARKKRPVNAVSYSTPITAAPKQPVAKATHRAAERWAKSAQPHLEPARRALNLRGDLQLQ
jgi:putative addiction module component (TIGR02574 family)